MNSRTSSGVGCVVAGLIFVGCGPGLPSVAISVVDHADALTPGANDTLCVLTVTRAAQPLDLGELVVVVGLPGQTASVVNYTHADSNTNGVLDQGEVLTVSEPPVNLFDATTVGKIANVNLSTKVNGVLTQIASAKWTPTN